MKNNNNNVYANEKNIEKMNTFNFDILIQVNLTMERELSMWTFCAR